VYYETTIDGEVLVPVLRDAALVASKAAPGAWHAVRVGQCDCDNFAYLGTCRHEKALRRFLGVDEDTPTYAQWLTQRVAR
jgi:hypothetical protein